MYLINIIYMHMYYNSMIKIILKVLGVSNGPYSDVLWAISCY